MSADQLSLFGPRPPRWRPAPHAKGSRTSKAAARRIEPHREPQKIRLLRLYAAAGEAGLTDDEIAQTQEFKEKPNSIRARRHDLRDQVWIRKVEGVTRLTLAENPAEVWQITPAGLARLEDAE